MRRTPVALITLAGSLVVAACSGRDTTAPRGIAARGPDASVTPAPSTTCDFSAIKTAARSYFTSNQDSAITYDGAMQKAYNGGQDGNATAIGWQIGRLVAKERLTAATTNATAGSVYLIDVLRCMSDLTVSAPYPPLPLPQKFLDNAISVLTSGIWEVRGGAVNSQVPAAGRVIDNTSHARAFGQPRWGAEAQSGTWPGATQYAVYGYPTTPTPLVAGSPANINTNEVPANAFELGTIPDASTKAGIRVGVCVQTDPSTGVANRIIHNGSEILDKDYLTQLCSTIINGYTAMGPAASTWYASAVNRAATFFAPKNLYADDDCAFCIGGLPSGWSPFSANAITAANISLAYVGPAPHNVNIGQVQTVVVSASTGTPSTPVPGVSVSISITGNSGQPGGATFGDSSTTITGTTLANGTVTFTFSVNKAGGYSLTTAGTLDTFPLGNTLVTFINVKNQ